MNLGDCASIADLRSLALRKLPRPIRPYLEGAAESEITARRNVVAFDELNLDLSRTDPKTRILGRDVNWPIYCSPTGMSRLFHPHGEIAVARAAADAGIYYGLSTMASRSIEEVAAASSGPKLFQFFIFKDRDLSLALIERCRRAGYSALCLTVDTPMRGNCERERRLGISQRFTLRNLASFAFHPAWSLGQLREGKISIPIDLDQQLDPSVTWRDLRLFIESWDGPFAIKGIMDPDDARRAVDAGASAVIVSNHGGRQLDGAAASIEALPDIVRAVGDHAEVLIDGGIRHGAHIAKALALGAKACGIGRSYLFGLAAAGEAGVRKALEILQREFTT